MVTPDEKDVIAEVCREDAEARAKGIGSVHHTPYGSISSYPALAAIVTSDPREMQVKAPNARLGSVLMHGEGCTPVQKFSEVLTLPDYDELRQQLADVSHERDLLREAADKMVGGLQYMIVRKGLNASELRLIAKQTINGAFVPESKS